MRPLSPSTLLQATLCCAALTLPACVVDPVTGASDGDEGEGEAGEGEGEEGEGEGEGEGEAGEGEGEGEGDLADFSFFVTSLVAMQELSGNQLGFGGDLRFGETGAGAGLRGADKICAAIAERSMPGSSSKQWRAFLSVVDDGTGQQVDAIDRIGAGPWFDRLGRLVANTTAELQNTRPANADPAIKNDLPNEDGVPNQRPDPTRPAVDNHHFMTGSNSQGRLFSSTSTCADYTTLTFNGRPHMGLSWPRNVGPGPGGGGGDSSANWINSTDEAGCNRGVNLIQTGPPDFRQDNVGSGGGYGGFYCFALTR